MLSNTIKRVYCVCNNCKETYSAILYFDSYIVEPARADTAQSVNLQPELTMRSEKIKQSLYKKELKSKTTLKDEDSIKLTFRE